jgi:hypothetical protein
MQLVCRKGIVYNKTLVRYFFRRGIIYATQLAFIFVMIMSENFLFKFAKENFGKINWSVN